MSIWADPYTVMPWLRLKPPVECISHPYDMYKVFSHLDMLWMGILIHLYTVSPVRIGS